MNKKFIEEYEKSEDKYLDDYKTHATYKLNFKKFFSVLRSRGYGLFLPKLWKYPPIARLFQSFFDFVFQKITPELFHDKIYLLQNNIQEPKP